MEQLMHCLVYLIYTKKSNDNWDFVRAGGAGVHKDDYKDSKEWFLFKKKEDETNQT
jgi:hypothetical protein